MVSRPSAYRATTDRGRGLPICSPSGCIVVHPGSTVHKVEKWTGQTDRMEGPFTRNIKGRSSPDQRKDFLRSPHVATHLKVLEQALTL
ncbi:hypothetical protein VTO42DRAFT_769 [Malbranchea cinnamomea]